MRPSHRILYCVAVRLSSDCTVQAFKSTLEVTKSSKLVFDISYDACSPTHDTILVIGLSIFSFIYSVDSYSWVLTSKGRHKREQRPFSQESVGG